MWYFVQYRNTTPVFFFCSCCLSKRKKLRRKKKRQLNRIATGYFSFFFIPTGQLKRNTKKAKRIEKKEMANFEKLLIVFQWNKNRKERRRENKMNVWWNKKNLMTPQGGKIIRQG